ncbi:MAG: RNA polymerase sigma factor [Acidimicrobiales bacterium]
MDEETEANLAAQAAAGHKPAFVALVERNRSTIVAACAKGCDRDRRLLEDCVQEALAEIWRSLPSFRASSAFGTWAYVIAFRVARRLRRRALADEAELGPELAGGLPRASGETADDERIVTRRAALEALSRLSADKRRLVRLHYYEGRTIEEIAGLLDVPVGTVKSRMNRLRSELKGYLQGDGDVV